MEEILIVNNLRKTFKLTAKQRKINKTDDLYVSCMFAPSAERLYFFGRYHFRASEGVLCDGGA